jgi:hypothetical protein
VGGGQQISWHLTAQAKKKRLTVTWSRGARGHPLTPFLTPFVPKMSVVLWIAQPTPIASSPNFWNGASKFNSLKRDLSQTFTAKPRQHAKLKDLLKRLFLAELEQAFIESASAHILWSILRKLIWPLPWRFELPDRLLSVEELAQPPELINYRQSGIRQLFEIPLFHACDNPLRSLYRLYEDPCADHFVMMEYECTHFFYQPHGRWSLVNLPDPKDDDLVRYAILASMVECVPLEVRTWNPS